MPNARAMRAVTFSEGFFRSSSTPPSICRETPARRASSESVQPRRSRRRRMTPARARFSGIGNAHVKCQSLSVPARLFSINPKSSCPSERIISDSQKNKSNKFSPAPAPRMAGGQSQTGVPPGGPGLKAGGGLMMNVRRCRKPNKVFEKSFRGGRRTCSGGL